MLHNKCSIHYLKSDKGKQFNWQNSQEPVVHMKSITHQSKDQQKGTAHQPEREEEQVNILGYCSEQPKFERRPTTQPTIEWLQPTCEGLSMKSGLLNKNTGFIWSSAPSEDIASSPGCIGNDSLGVREANQQVEPHNKKWKSCW